MVAVTGLGVVPIYIQQFQPTMILFKGRLDLQGHVFKETFVPHVGHWSIRPRQRCQQLSCSACVGRRNPAGNRAVFFFEPKKRESSRTELSTVCQPRRMFA